MPFVIDDERCDDCRQPRVDLHIVDRRTAETKNIRAALCWPCWLVRCKRDDQEDDRRWKAKESRVRLPAARVRVAIPRVQIPTDRVKVPATRVRIPVERVRISSPPPPTAGMVVGRVRVVSNEV